MEAVNPAMGNQKIVTRMGKGGVMTAPLKFHYFLRFLAFLLSNESYLRIFHNAEKKTFEKKLVFDQDMAF